MSEYEKLSATVVTTSAFDNKGKRQVPTNKPSPKRLKFLAEKKANQLRENRNERAASTLFDKSERRPLPEDRPPASPFYENPDYVPSPDYVSFATLRIKTCIKSTVIKSLLCDLHITDREGDPTQQGLQSMRKGRDGKYIYHKSLISLIKQQHSEQNDPNIVFDLF